MGINIEPTKEYYQTHLSVCWEEHKRFKETKDKIVFFIGTLFMTVLCGSGLLIYKSYEMNKLPNPDTAILDKLYVIQYFLMHLFFFLLFLYYTYNNILEKIFLIEAQCCHYKMKELLPEFNDCISTPHSLIKKNFAEGVNIDYWLKVRTFKDVSNFLMIVIYLLFSAIPLFFKRDFILINPANNSTEVKFQISWIVIGLAACGLLVIVVFVAKNIINAIKRQILENWKIPEHNIFRI